MGPYSRKALTLGLYLPVKEGSFVLLCPALAGTGTIALDPTFGSFTLLEPVLHYVNQIQKCGHSR
jgi:hypothetical protein